MLHFYKNSENILKEKKELKEGRKVERKEGKKRERERGLGREQALPFRIGTHKGGCGLQD